VVQIAKGMASNSTSTSATTAGSALVQYGSNTRVMVHVTLQIGRPAVNTTTTTTGGSITISYPKDCTLERWLQQLVQMVELEASPSLCIQPNVAAWKLLLSCHVLEDGGNLYDACAMAVMAALMDTKLPTVMPVAIVQPSDTTRGTETTQQYAIVNGPTTLLQLRFIPIPISFGMYYSDNDDGGVVHCVLDPTTREEPILMGRLSMILIDSTVAHVSWSSSTGVGLTPDNIIQATKVATHRAKELTQLLVTT
jgi:exosome complex RNA-binding protein Rrp42 (RNase PH superfamily)